MPKTNPFASPPIDIALVRCFVCNKQFKSLPAHLRHTHAMSVPEYQDYCKKRGEVADLGYTVRDERAKAKAQRSKEISERKNAINPLPTLTKEEQQFYKEKYKILWEASNEDPVLQSTIHEVVMNQLFIRRYQLQLQNVGAKANPRDLVLMHEMVNKLQKQTLELLASLNLTKERRDALNKSPESTPSRLVSGLAFAIANMTPTEQAKNEKDMAEAMDRLRKHTEELLQIQPDGEVNEELISLDE